MKKNMLIFTLLFSLSSMALDAQNFKKPNRKFRAGQTDLQIGNGLLPLAGLLNDATVILPPLTLRLGYFFSKNFSLGTAYTFSSMEGNPNLEVGDPSVRIRLVSHLAGIRAAAHFTELPNADLYGGCMLGVYFQRFHILSDSPSYPEGSQGFRHARTTLSYSAFLGARYAFLRKWSVFGELGFSTALATVGIGRML
ncbi:MAG: outer membrane beta-barrel protein [Lewinellaceae bacterium]|nr:outer membrane beta-barrel protein [Saprospiraceae bacterium]MCB9337644.1 outer membrane beta-barrel protein [Lewinellaceae bacterium]